MFTLQLHRFKGCVDFQVELKEKDVILLNGKSGRGKTTILDALSFVLHDGAKNSCYPRTERGNRKQETTFVRLIFPNGLSIYRQRRPNLLQVSFNGQELIDDEAEGYINQIFGPISSWQAGGYLKQNDYCAFLSMSSGEKLKFLQELSLPTNFEVFFQRVSERLQETTSSLNETGSQIKAYEQMYMNMYNSTPEEIKQKSLWSIEELDGRLRKYGLRVTTNEFYQKLHVLYHEGGLKYLEDKISSLRQEVVNLTITRSQVESVRKQRADLLGKYSAAKTELETLGDVNTDEEIANLESAVHILKEQITAAKNSVRRDQLISARTELQRRLESYGPEETSKYTRQALDEMERIKKDYSLEQFDELLSKITSALNYYQHLEEYNKRQAMVKQLSEQEALLASYPEKSYQEEIETLSQKIWMLGLQQQKMTCPNCSTDLYLNQGRLETVPEMDLEDVGLHELHQKRSQLQEREQLYQRRGPLEIQISSSRKRLASMPNIELPEAPELKTSPDQLIIQKHDLLARRQKRENLPDLDIDLERKRLANTEQRRLLSKDLDSIDKDLAGLPSDLESSQKLIVEELEESRKEKSSRLSYLKSNQQAIAVTKSKCESFQTQLDNLTTVDFDESKFLSLQKEVNDLIEEQRILREDISHQNHLYQLDQMFRKHSELSQSFSELNQRLAAYQKIKATLVTAEYVILDRVLADINITLSGILGILFEEPISVTLRSLRQLKTTDRIKPEINLEIWFKDAEFSTLSDLSGGERSRVSLALEIAFARLNKHPFVLFDESLAPLDVVNKENAIAAIRSYLSEKTIITVNHDTTEGVYDSVIDLD